MTPAKTTKRSTKSGSSGSRKNGSSGAALPRLGSEQAPEATPRTEEVEIPVRGVSVVIAPPRVENLLEIQESGGFDDDASPRKSFEATVRLVAEMLVEPELTEDELRAEVEAWEMSDWVALQRAALVLSGMGASEVAQAEEGFQESKNG